jgi:hypothetical protein
MVELRFKKSKFAQNIKFDAGKKTKFPNNLSKSCLMKICRYLILLPRTVRWKKCALKIFRHFT